MQENFEKIMVFVFDHEGWRSNDESDAGGRTVWGICERDYPNEVAEMWDLEKEASKTIAKTIFRKKYWDKIDGDNLPKGSDAIIMDTAVNMGVTFANSLKNYDYFTALIKRIERYVAIAATGKNIKFLRGWVRRATDLYYFVNSNI